MKGRPPFITAYKKEVQRFFNQNNEETVFVWESIFRTEPGTRATDRGDDCNSSARYQFLQSDENIAFEFNFIQEDFSENQAFKDQRIRLQVIVQSSAGIFTDRSAFTTFELTQLDLNNSETPPDVVPARESVYKPELTIDCIAYFDALQRTWLNSTGQFVRYDVDEQAQLL